MVKKICVVTGNRAEYGLLRWVIQGIQNSSLLDLQLVVTGAHLSPDFGLTVQEIEQDGFQIDYRVEMLLSSDTSVGVTKSLGLGVIGFADALDKLKPDVLLVLGDRYEIFAAATAGMLARIPIAHIHGGELTEGLIDEAIRHGITKMSHLHFVAAEDYRRRVIQMGESAERVFNVGGLGVESVRRTPLMARKEVEKILGFEIRSPSFLVTYHPLTLDPGASISQFSEMLGAFKIFPEAQVIFTMPNSDSEGRALMEMIDSFCTNHSNAHFLQPNGQEFYLSVMASVDGVVGNSSSGLLEAPAVGVGTINIGDRQSGRIKAHTVVDLAGDRDSIYKAMLTLSSKKGSSYKQKNKNPYGTGEASVKIVKALEQTETKGLLIKKFVDGVKS